MMMIIIMDGKTLWFVKLAFGVTSIYIDAHIDL